MRRYRDVPRNDVPAVQRPPEIKIQMLLSTSVVVLGLMFIVVCLLIAGVLGLVALLFNGGEPGMNYWVSLIGVAAGIVITVSSGTIVFARMRYRHLREARSWREVWDDELISRGQTRA